MNTLPLEQRVYLSEAFPATDLDVEVEERSSSIVVVRLRGQAAEAADDLAQALQSSVVPATRFVIVDLAALKSISRAALQTLVAFRRSLCWRGGEVWLAGLQPDVWLALRRANYDKLFSIRDSVAQVFAS